MQNNHKKKKLHNAIHIFLLLLLANVVILFITNSKLFLAENFFVSSVKYITALSLYKLIILSFTEINHSADLYISLLYLIFIAAFANIHFATRKNENIYLHDLAFHNWHSFSGVIGFHIYNSLFPRLHLDSKENYSIYESKVSNKKLDVFFIEQLHSKGAHAYFTFMFLFGFVFLPLAAIWTIDVTTIRVVSFWLVCLLMTYTQIKTVFELLLVFRAVANKNKM
jgi:hypothetical protein